MNFISNNCILNLCSIDADIDENRNGSTLLITVSATDADSIASGFGRLNYSIETVNNSDSFSINDTGVITATAPLDREDM